MSWTWYIWCVKLVVNPFIIITLVRLLESCDRSVFNDSPECGIVNSMTWVEGRLPHHTAADSNSWHILFEWGNERHQQRLVWGVRSAGRFGRFHPLSPPQILIARALVEAQRWPLPTNASNALRLEQVGITPVMLRQALRQALRRSHVQSHLLRCKRQYSVFRVSSEVSEAIRDQRPVVALESTIYTHGFPHPDNAALALSLEMVVRLNGGVPATIAILNGEARVGLSSDELLQLAEAAGKKETMKVSRRDLGLITGMVRLMLVSLLQISAPWSRNQHGYLWYRVNRSFHRSRNLELNHSLNRSSWTMGRICLERFALFDITWFHFVLRRTSIILSTASDLYGTHVDTSQGFSGSKLNGGTTVSGTMVLAAKAGIDVFGTGGLGGVHRQGQDTMDISADLTELGRTPVCVVSSGCKSFLDIPRTLEYLETQGALVATFADGRKGDIDFPAFWTRDSGVRSPAVIQNEFGAASIICTSVQKRFFLAEGLSHRVAL